MLDIFFNNMKISIITPSYNSSNTIKNTINSILTQKFLPFEYIVIDNNSTDDTVEIVNSYLEDFKSAGINFVIISEPDNGIYDAMNKGILIASGDFVGIINSDDYYANNALYDLHETYKKNKADIYHGSIIMHDNLVYSTHSPKNENKNYRYNMFHPTMFVSRSLYQKIGLYSTLYKLSSDYDWIIRANLATSSKHKINGVITYYYIFGASYRNRLVGIKENYLIRKVNGISFFSNMYLLVVEILMGPLNFKTLFK